MAACNANIIKVAVLILFLLILPCFQHFYRSRLLFRTSVRFLTLGKLIFAVLSIFLPLQKCFWHKQQYFYCRRFLLPTYFVISYKVNFFCALFAQFSPWQRYFAQCVCFSTVVEMFSALFLDISTVVNLFCTQILIFLLV